MLTQKNRPPDAKDDRSVPEDHETLQYEEHEDLERIYGDSFKTVYSKPPSYTEMRASPA